MKCHEAREFFSPYLDGELTPAEINILERHLERCPACRRELSRWQELSQTLQGLAAPVTAPPDFAAAVAARVAARQQPRPWQSLRRWAAAAAAVAVLAAGTLGYAGRGLWQQLPLLASNPPGQQVDIDDPGAEVNLPPLTGEADINEPAAPANQDPAVGDNRPDEGKQPGTAPGNDSPDPGSGSKENNLPPDPGKPEPPFQVAGTDTYTAQAFLSDGRQTSSTLLKLAVGDLAAAKATVTDLAAINDASLQVIAEGNSGPEKRFIYQMAVSNEQANALLAALSKAGTVTAQNINTQDLTQQFAATLEQYQAKVAQANSAAEPEEKTKLLQEAKALEQQLQAWERESKQQTIVLWLEVK